MTQHPAQVTQNRGQTCVNCQLRPSGQARRVLRQRLGDGYAERMGLVNSLRLVFLLKQLTQQAAHGPVSNADDNIDVTGHRRKLCV